MVDGREYTYTKRATTEKINTRHHLPGAPITIVLRAVRVYKSGSSREGLFRALPAHSPGPGVPVSAGIRKGVRNSWRCGMAAGSSSLAAASPARARGLSAAGAATGWPRGAGSAASWRHRRCRHDRAERGGGAVFSVRCPGLSGGDRGCRQPAEAHPSSDARLPFRVQGCRNPECRLAPPAAPRRSCALSGAGLVPSR